MSATVEPTIRRADRRIVAEWRVSEKWVATLTVYHSASSKCFTAILRQEEDMGDGVRGHLLFGGREAVISRVRVNRYSERTLNEVFDIALVEVDAGREKDQWPSIFSPPAESETA